MGLCFSECLYHGQLISVKIKMFWLRFLKGWPNQAAAHLQICPNLPRKAKNGCHSVQGKSRGVKICIIVMYYLENMWKERKLGFICYFFKENICFYCFPAREVVFFTIEKTLKLNFLKKRSQNILKVTYNVEKYLNIWILAVPTTEHFVFLSDSS